MTRRLAARLALACAIATLRLAPACAAGADAPPLSPGQLQQLLDVNDAKGTRIFIPAPVQTILTLRPEQVKDGIKQVMFQDEAGVRHGFAPLEGGTGFFMVRRAAGDNATDHSVFHVDAELKLVKAAHNFSSTNRLVELPRDEAERELQQEWSEWSKILPSKPPGQAASKPLQFRPPAKTAPPAPPASSPAAPASH